MRLSFLLDCEKTPVPAAALKRTQLALIDENQTKLARLHRGTTAANTAPSDMFELGFAGNAAKIVRLAKVLKIDRGDWAMAMEQNSLAFFDGILSGESKGKNYYLIEDFILEMMQDLALEDPELAPYFQTYSAFPGKNIAFGHRLAIEPALSACELIVKKAQTGTKLPEWKGPEKDPEKNNTPQLAIPEFPAAEAVLSQLQLTEKPFARCVKCHEGQGAKERSRRIPFGYPRSLEKNCSPKAPARTAPCSTKSCPEFSPTRPATCHRVERA